MLADRMTDDSGDTKDPLHNQSSEPHIVVACPACKTKFAVESSLIASYEIPKFHCSRCDAVFELNRTPRVEKAPVATSPATGGTESQRWILSDNANQSMSNPFAQRNATQTSLRSSDFTLGEAAPHQAQEPRKHFAPLEERAGLSLLGLRPSAGPVLTSSVTRQEALSRAGSDAKLNTKTPANDEIDPFSLFDAPGTHPSTPESKPTQKALQPETSRRSDEEVAKEIKVTESRQETPNQQPTEKTAAKPRRTLLAALRGASRSVFNRLSERNRGLVRLSLPLASAFTLLCILGYAGQLMPQTIDALFRATTPALLTGKISRLPPAELQVNDISIGFEKTQSKETLPVVRGVIQNTGEKQIEDVLVEALGFNSRGEVLIRAQAPLRSALTREKISDLPLATVKKFQTSLSARNSTIGAQEKVAFSIALLSDSAAPQDLAYFSARIFSVGASRR